MRLGRSLALPSCLASGFWRIVCLVVFLKVTFMLAPVAVADEVFTNVMSPVVSYQFYDSLEHLDTNSVIMSPVASYQYFDWPDAGSVQFLNSPAVSYFYPFLPFSATPRARPETRNISPALGASVQFYGWKSTSSSGCFDIASYFWDFGDGTTSTLMNPTHAFFPTGSRAYGVTLTVADTLGLSDQQTLSIYVSGQSVGVSARSASRTVSPV